MNIRLLPLVALATLLSACATAPKPLQGQFTGVTPRDSVAGAQTGAQVRWGGRIVETVPGPDRTCFQMISRPLGGDGRPLSSAADATDGRFVACRAGFYDPAVFEEGREVTFIGRIDGYETARIGEYDYRLPRVSAEVVYLWPDRSQAATRAYPYPHYYDPFWGPWGPWGWGRWSWWW